MTLTTIILFISSLAVILVAVRTLIVQRAISSKGIEADGTIFDFEKSMTPNETMSFPMVRFLTKDQIWMTKVSKLGIVPGIYKKGQKVSIVYHKEFPDKFYIKDSSRLIVPIGMLIIGLILLIIAVDKLIYI